MKKALSLLFMFIIFLFAGTFLATVFYSFFLGVLNYVAGINTTVFEFKTILKAFFYTLPLIIMLTPPVLCYYRVRHMGTYPQLITYIVISSLCWIVFLPLTLKAQEYFFKDNYIVYQKKELTPNYFRQDKNEVYYFTENLSTQPFKKDSVSTVKIDTSADGSIEITEEIVSKDFILYKDAYPFTDIIIKETFSSNNLRFLIDYKVLLNYAYTSFHKGFSFYIGFLTMALCIISLFAFTKFFIWRLLNSIFIIFSTILIFFVNSFYFNPILDQFKNKYINNNSFFTFLEKFVDNPFLCIINISIFVILLSVLIINKLVKKYSNK